MNSVQRKGAFLGFHPPGHILAAKHYYCYPMKAGEILNLKFVRGRVPTITAIIL